MNENTLKVSDKFKIAVPHHLNYRFKSINVRKHSVKRLFLKNVHFAVFYMQSVLNAIGLNITFSNVKGNCENSNMLLKFPYYIWNVITIIQILTFLSHVFTIPMNRHIKIYITHALQRAFSLTIRIFIWINKEKYKSILLEMTTFHNLKYLISKTFKYKLIFAALYIHACSIISAYVLLKSLTLEEIELRNARNIFNVRLNRYSAEILLAFVTFVWIYVTICMTSLFALAFNIFGSILKNEFLQLIGDIKICLDETKASTVIENYDKALEIGKAFDDAASLTVFSVLGFILISLFFNGYRLFVTSMIGTYQVFSILLSFISFLL